MPLQLIKCAQKTTCFVFPQTFYPNFLLFFTYIYLPYLRHFATLHVGHLVHLQAGHHVDHLVDLHFSHHGGYLVHLYVGPLTHQIGILMQSVWRNLDYCKTLIRKYHRRTKRQTGVKCQRCLGWDGIDCGDWCHHRSNECSMAHSSPSQQSNSLWVCRVIPENIHHNSGGVVTVVCAMPPEHPLLILTLILRFRLPPA